MNWIDISLIIIILFSIGASIKRGFIISTWDLLSWLGSLLIGFITYKPLGEMLLQAFPTIGFWAPILVFMLSILISRLILDQLGGHLMDLLPSGIHRNPLNKLLGVAPGLVNGLIWATIIATLLLFVPISSEISRETQDARLAAPLLSNAGWIQDKLYPVFSEIFNNGLAKKSPAISKDESIKLPYTVKNSTIRPDLEDDMLVLLNKERAKEGLKALLFDSELRAVARAHSTDMFFRGYFSHINPSGENPFHRIDAAGIRYLSAGENLALAQTLFIAHSGLMNSPGHRANILNPGFGRVGIGVLDGGVYGLMITQNFRN